MLFFCYICKHLQYKIKTNIRSKKTIVGVTIVGETEVILTWGDHRRWGGGRSARPLPGRPRPGIGGSHLDTFVQGRVFCAPSYKRGAPRRRCLSGGRSPAPRAKRGQPLFSGGRRSRTKRRGDACHDAEGGGVRSAPEKGVARASRGGPPSPQGAEPKAEAIGRGQAGRPARPVLGSATRRLAKRANTVTPGERRRSRSPYCVPL